MPGGMKGPNGPKDNQKGRDSEILRIDDRKIDGETSSEELEPS